MKINRPLLIVIALAGSFALSFGLKHEIRKPSAKTTLVDCPTFDTTQVIIKMSDCGASNGSVIGLSAHVTGTPVFAWYDAKGVKLSSGADLIHVPPGVYRVSLQDDSKCPAISLFYYVFENNSVKIDLASAVITRPACNAVNGSVTNIKITNATSFTWTDVNNNIIATTKDLKNVGPGTYLLTASDQVTGCISQAKFTVDAGADAPVMTSDSLGDTDCGSIGEFHAKFDIKPGDPTFTWVLVNRTTGKVPFTGALSYTPGITANITIPAPSLSHPNPNPGLSAGTYDLVTTGPGFCNTILTTFTINEMQGYRIDTSHMVVKSNVCGKYTGVILGLSTINGPAPWGPGNDMNPDHNWFWFDSAGNHLLAFHGNLIAGVPSGWYTVYAVNHEGCATEKMRLFLPDSVSTASKPQLNDIKMCLPGTAALDVLNKDPGAHYTLYDSTQQTVLDTSVAGYFSRKVNVTTTFYIQSINGICGSPLGKVTVTVVNPGVSIPNTFTPNNDGINDIWAITGLDQYPGTEVTVFNRNGQQVYHSINYGSPFSGHYNGKELSVGVYYYIIDTKKPDCRGGVSGSLTIIR